MRFLDSNSKSENSHRICPAYQLSPLARAGEALAQLVERLAHSLIGKGVITRAHYADTCASQWIDGELVEIEYPVLHEAARDIRSPSHALTTARDVS